MESMALHTHGIDPPGLIPCAQPVDTGSPTSPQILAWLQCQSNSAFHPLAVTPDENDLPLSHVLVRRHAAVGVEDDGDDGITDEASHCAEEQRDTSLGQDDTADLPIDHLDTMSNVESFITKAKYLIANGDACLSLVEEDCVGGTYWLSANGERVGVFKPSDEEAGSVANPKGMGEGDGPKIGCTPGGGAAREALACALDHGSFAGVPETAVISVPSALLGRQAGEEVEGSLQRFVESIGHSWDKAPGRFDAASTRRVGLLDLRLLNCDRHGGNLLVTEGATLVPIDHGNCVPCELADLDFEWLMWPQAKTPFSAEELAYIAALDPDADVRTAREYGVGVLEAELLKAACVALQIGCQNGLTLRQLGSYWQRGRMNEPSPLELLISSCRGSIEQGAAIDWDCFRKKAERELS